MHLFVNPAPTKQAVVDEFAYQTCWNEWMTLDFCANVRFWISGSRRDIWEGGRKHKQKQRRIKGSKSNSIRKLLPKWKPGQQKPGELSEQTHDRPRTYPFLPAQSRLVLLVICELKTFHILSLSPFREGLSERGIKKCMCGVKYSTGKTVILWSLCVVSHRY